jgi:hypothetical protein
MATGVGQVPLPSSPRPRSECAGRSRLTYPVRLFLLSSLIEGARCAVAGQFAFDCPAHLASARAQGALDEENTLDLAIQGVRTVRQTL